MTTETDDLIFVYRVSLDHISPRHSEVDRITEKELFTRKLKGEDWRPVLLDSFNDRHVWYLYTYAMNVKDERIPAIEPYLTDKYSGIYRRNYCERFSLRYSKKNKTFKPILRCCASCEWIFVNHTDCPKCGFGSYTAHYVYGKLAYKYAKTQEPYLEKRRLKELDRRDRRCG